jgi:hypothetical protein
MKIDDVRRSNGRNASIALLGHAETASNFFICRLTLRLAIGLVIAAAIVIGLTSPSGAQKAEEVRTGLLPSSLQRQDGNAPQLAQCLQDWDAGTHMTQEEWSGACHRLLLQRGDYLRKHRQ